MTAALPTFANIDELAARYRAGESLLGLSSEAGVSRGALKRQLADAGVEIRGRSEASRLRPYGPHTPPGKVALYLAAEHVGINRRVLAEAIDAGFVRASRIERPGTGTRYQVVLSELAEDLAGRPRCSGCDRPALRRDGTCGSCGVGRKGPRTPTGSVALHLAAAEVRVSRQILAREIRAGHLRAEVVGSGAAHPYAYAVDLSQLRADLAGLPLRHLAPDPPTERFCARCKESIGLLRRRDNRKYCDKCRWIDQPRSGGVVTCPGCGFARYRPRALLGTGEGWCLDCWNESERALENLQRLRGRHSVIDQALLSEGLVPAASAATLAGWSVGNLPRKLNLVRREFGGTVRLGVDARELLPLSVEKNARGKLAKPLAALNGTEHVGRPPVVLTDDELAIAERLRSEGRGWRQVRDAVNERRPVDERISHVTAQQAFERQARAPAASV